MCFEYYWIEEKFTNHGPLIAVNDEGDIAWQETNDSNGVLWNTVYGNKIIDTNNTFITRYKWTFKVLNFEDKNGYFIGIDASMKQHTNGDFTSSVVNNAQFYSFTATGWMYAAGRNTKTVHNKRQLEIGDIVCLQLDIKEKTLKLYINDLDAISTGHVFEDINVKDVNYTMAVTLSQKQHKIQLLKFEAERL